MKAKNEKKMERSGGCNNPPGQEARGTNRGGETNIGYKSRYPAGSTSSIRSSRLSMPLLPNPDGYFSVPE